MIDDCGMATSPVSRRMYALWSRWAAFVSGGDYLTAERYRRLLGERFAQCFADFDVVVSPTMPPHRPGRLANSGVRVGPREESVLAVSWRLTYPWNLLGFARREHTDRKMTVMVLPIGLQIAAPAFAEGGINSQGLRRRWRICTERGREPRLHDRRGRLRCTAARRPRLGGR